MPEDVPRTGEDTVPNLVARNRATWPEADAIVTPDGVLTHLGLESASRAVAARLIDAGVEHGTRVGLLAENGTGWAAVAVAVTRIGAVLVPVSTLLREPELTAQLDVAEVEVMVATGVFRGRDMGELATSAARRVGGVTSVLDLAGLTRDVPSDSPAPRTGSTDDRVRSAEARVTSDDPLVILFTSGSRGVPKGIVHSHGNAIRAVRTGLDARRVGPDDRMYLPMPMFWTGGFSVGLCTTLVAGNALLTEAEPEPSTTLEFLADAGATLFRGWPDQAARLAAHPGRSLVDLSGLRDASLPALLPPERRPPPGARPNLLGMTETFGPWCGERLDSDLPAELRGCCGRPFPGVELRVVDPDTGVDVPKGGVGEFWLRGPSLLRGICGRDHDEVFTADGWFRTGDTGRSSEGGHVWLVGRLDDQFKVSGATVYPAEVETALRSLDGVAEAHVAPVRDGGSPRVGALVISSTAPEVLRAELREVLSPFKVPSRWIVTTDRDAVPRGATGKVDMAALEQLLATRSVGVPRG